MTSLSIPHCSAADLAARLDRQGVSVIDVREPMEYAAGHIPGSRNIPLAQLAGAQLPEGPLVLVCQSGNRSARGVQALLQQAGYPVRRLAYAPLPLMRQVQIAAGGLVLLGLLLSQLVAPPWILLSWFVGAGLVFAGVTGFCGMARLLALMPWNRLAA